MDKVTAEAESAGLIKKGDTVVFSAGMPLQVSGTDQSDSSQSRAVIIWRSVHKKEKRSVAIDICRGRPLLIFDRAINNKFDVRLLFYSSSTAVSASAAF